MPRIYTTLPWTQRFWTKVDFSNGPDGCWLWTSYTDRRGYGKFGIGGRVFLAHRLAYELKNGPLPPGIFACHSCDVPGCINPAHLWPGTDADNHRDMRQKGRHSPPPILTGAKNHATKLTEGDVRAIRAAHASGRSALSLAQQHHVTHRTIWQLLRGETWRHVV